MLGADFQADQSSVSNLMFINLLPHRDAFLTLLQTEQTQIRQLLEELSDQGLL